MRFNRQIIRVVSASVLIAVLVAGCGSDDESGTDTTTTAVGGSATASSTTIAPSTTEASGDSTTEVDVYFVDTAAFSVGTEPYVIAVQREVDSADPITGAVDALFEGPEDADKTAGLELVSSGATGAKVVSIGDGVARVQLIGGCDSGGSTLTVAAELISTLKQFDQVQTVKILDLTGETIDDASTEDSTPECLEP